MIQVESITIKEFRGIRNLKLDLNAKTFAVYGPNGTGKSGVVDALEFALTGTVSRLTGAGRGDISLLAHGPHVDQRSAPEKAKVEMVISIPSLGKKVTIERGVKAPSKPKITPEDPKILEVLATVAAHPEVVLSRREIIKYVLATPGDRAQEIQALLRLDDIEKVRAGLQKIANATEKVLTGLKSSESDARSSLLRALGISELTGDKVIAVANEKRAVLGLLPILELTESNSLRDGLEVLAVGTQQRVAKAQAKADAENFSDLLSKLGEEQTAQVIAKAIAEVDALVADADAAHAVQRERFYLAGSDFITGDACPFCDVPWDQDDLRAHVHGKIEHLQELSRKGKLVDEILAPLATLLRGLAAASTTIAAYARKAEPPIPSEALQALASALTDKAAALSVATNLSNVTSTLKGLVVIPAEAKEVVTKVDAYVAALPEPTKIDAARDWLVVAQERLEVLREARRKLKAGREKAERARKISDVYAKTTDSVLSTLYDSVQDEFARLYRTINRDDESKFQAKLTPSMGKLGFDVDFYGRGFFPPGAYHSEGHQDGMGLCLYLALMKRMQGDGFRFAVLDDVLMSVDSGHRREVCALLRTEFPNTQFVLTTHDKIWLKHMRTEGLTTAKGAVEFRAWTVDQGPTQWHDRDVWKEIDAELAGDEVRKAAAMLRNYLEFVSGELCHRLRAPVAFRGDAMYQLGELLPSAVGQLKKLYGKGKAAANSWNQEDVLKGLAEREKTFGALVQKSNVERWQVNAAIHFNAWENLGRSDFEPVAKAYKALLEGFACSICGEVLKVSPEREAMESLRCSCGKTNINLKEKGSA